MRATEEETYTDEEIDKLAEEIASEIAGELDLEEASISAKGSGSISGQDPKKTAPLKGKGLKKKKVQGGTPGSFVSEEDDDDDDDEDEVEETKKSSKKSVKSEGKKRSKSEGENPFKKDDDEDDDDDDDDEVEETKKSSKKSVKSEGKKAAKSVKKEEDDEEEEDDDDEDVAEEVTEGRMQKQEMIRNVFAQMQRTRKTSLTDNYEKLMGLLFQEEDDEDDEDKDEVEENSAPIWHHEKVTKEDLDISEDLKGIFGSSDSELSEDFMNGAKTIFEAAVVAKINSELELIETSYATKLEEEKDSITEEITGKVDDYLSYVVSEWVESNELAIEAGLKSEITEDFIGGLKTLFEEHYIELPDDKVDVVETLADRVEKLEEQLNETLSNNVELSAQVNSFTKDQILADVSDDLTDVQKDKINSLAENIDFANDDQYREALVNIKEGYFSTAAAGSQASRTVDQVESELTEEGEAPKAASPQMEAYMNVIGRTIENY